MAYGSGVCGYPPAGPWVMFLAGECAASGLLSVERCRDVVRARLKPRWLDHGRHRCDSVGLLVVENDWGVRMAAAKMVLSLRPLCFEVRQVLYGDGSVLDETRRRLSRGVPWMKFNLEWLDPEIQHVNSAVVMDAGVEMLAQVLAVKAVGMR